VKNKCPWANCECKETDTSEMNETKDKIDILNTAWKTQVTPEQSAEIQSLLFRLGQTWNERNTHIMFTNEKYLYYYHNIDYFTYCSDIETYTRHENKQINADEIIEALRKLENGDKPVIEETKDDEGWISVNDSLPQFSKTIEILFKDKYTAEASLAMVKDNISFLGKYGSVYLPFNTPNITHWRPLKERKPDFSKLNKGDIIIVEYNIGEKNAGIFEYEKMSTFGRIIYFKNGSQAIDCKIKKITRINLETKEFEEI
jgi:hypothetical protein